MIENSHGPVTEQYRELMNALAATIDGLFNPEGKPKTTGFCLLCFPFGEDPSQRINYISNARREDMLCAMREFVANAEGRKMLEPKTEQ